MSPSVAVVAFVILGPVPTIIVKHFRRRETNRKPKARFGPHHRCFTLGVVVCQFLVELLVHSLRTGRFSFKPIVLQCLCSRDSLLHINQKQFPFNCTKR